jgi:hypothetical protein
MYSDSKGQSQQAEYINAIIIAILHEINTKQMPGKGARTKIERNLEIACIMDERDDRRQGEMDV